MSCTNHDILISQDFIDSHDRLHNEYISLMAGALFDITNTNTMKELKQQIATIVHMVNTNSITPTEATNQLMALHDNVYVEQATKEQGAKQDNAGTEEE